MISLLTSIRNLFSMDGKTRALYPDVLRDEQGFNRLLEIERLRTSRNKQCFSVLVFDVGGDEESVRKTRLLVGILLRRLRDIDQIGWFAAGKVGALLPYTTVPGASAVAETLCAKLERVGLNLHCSLFVFPNLEEKTEMPVEAMDKPKNVRRA